MADPPLRTRIPGDVYAPPFPGRTGIPGDVTVPPPVTAPQGDVQQIANGSGAYYFFHEALVRAARASGAVIVAPSGWLPLGTAVTVLQKGGDPLNRGMWLISFTLGGPVLTAWMPPRAQQSGTINITSAR